MLISILLLLNDVAKNVSFERLPFKWLVTIKEKDFLFLPLYLVDHTKIAFQF